MNHFSSRRLNPLPDDDCLLAAPKIATEAQRITRRHASMMARTRAPGDVSAAVAASSWPHSTQWAKQGRRPLGTSEQGRYPAADPADMGTTLGYEAAAGSMQHAKDRADEPRAWLWLLITLGIVAVALWSRYW